jgi:hypothetical protein
MISKIGQIYEIDQQIDQPITTSQDQQIDRHITTSPDQQILIAVFGAGILPAPRTRPSRESPGGSGR